jgi:predicted nucleotidyltransferase
MKPSEALNANRDTIRALVAKSRARNPRVFGSVLHGNDKTGSDLDLLVDPLPETTLFDLGGLQSQLEDLLGVRVDVLTPGDISPRFRDNVIAKAEPV